MKKGKLRILQDGLITFWCKGCQTYHGVNIDQSKSPCWGFNGDYDNPTFTPSILVRMPHPEGYSRENPAPLGWEGKMVDDICHSFVTDGKIQYLNDCTHELAGQTVELEGDE